MPRGKTLNVLAITRSNDLKITLNGTLGERAGLKLDTLNGDLQTMNGHVYNAAAEADVLLIDVDVANEQEVTHLGRLVEQKGNKAVVLATTRDLSAQGMRNLIRQGVDDFIPQPLEPQDILDAVENARAKLRRLREGDRLGKVITVTRAHGGMGATTLAIHAALSLREKRRRRDPERRVALLDLDLQFGDTALMLDLPSKNEMARIIREPYRLDQDLLQAAMVEHKSGLAVLPPPVEPVPLEALPIEAASRLIELAREEFEYVVVDLPLALPHWMEAVLAQTDKLFVVTQLNVPAIRQTRRLLDIVKDEALTDAPADVVLNRYVWRLGERARLRQAVQALGQPIRHYLPDDPRLALDAINRGVSLFEAKRRARLCRALRNVTAASLATLQQATAAPAKAAQP